MPGNWPNNWPAGGKNFHKKRPCRGWICLKMTTALNELLRATSRSFYLTLRRSCRQRHSSANQPRLPAGPDFRHHCRYGIGFRPGAGLPMPWRHSGARIHGSTSARRWISGGWQKVARCLPKKSCCNAWKRRCGCWNNCPRPIDPSCPGAGGSCPGSSSAGRNWTSNDSRMRLNRPSHHGVGKRRGVGRLHLSRGRVRG